MTKTEAFKLGFLMQCRKEGLDESQTRVRVKQASVMVKTAGGFMDMVKWLASKGLWLGLVAPPAIGAAGGIALGKAQTTPYSKETARKDEELAEMYRAVDQLEAARRQRDSALT
jgi:hypothetical protein